MTENWLRGPWVNEDDEDSGAGAGSDYVYGAEAKDCPVFEDALGRGIKE